MNVIETDILGVKIIEPRVFADERGFFYEGYNKPRYREAGIDVSFVQDNLSRSTYGVLRGLHYQLQHSQAKLVTVVRGEVFDVAVDIRQNSPTFGKWVGVLLNEINHRQLFIPAGFAHGFCVLSEYADFYYKCSDHYHAEDEYGVAWNDEMLNIAWPLSVEPILSSKDKAYKSLSDVPIANLPYVG